MVDLKADLKMFALAPLPLLKGHVVYGWSLLSGLSQNQNSSTVTFVLISKLKQVFLISMKDFLVSELRELFNALDDILRKR